MLQAALKIHDIDTDSAMGVSIITDDRSSCRFSDDEEVSECVYVYRNTVIVNEKVANFANLHLYYRCGNCFPCKNIFIGCINHKNLIFTVLNHYGQHCSYTWFQ